MKNIFKLIPIIIILNGCTPKPLDIDLPTIDPKIVVNTVTLSESDSVIAIFLSKSFSTLIDGNATDSSALPYSNLIIDDAIVTVNYLGKTDTLFNIGEGFYLSSTTPLNRYTRYQLNIKDNRSDLTCSAYTTVLPEVSMTKALPIVNKTKLDTTIRIEIEANDNPNTEDYYLITYEIINKGSLNVKLKGPKQSKDINITELDLITDKNIDNNMIKVNKNLTNTLNGIKSQDTLLVTFSSITKEYYYFLGAFKRSNSLFNQLTGEPINLPTNVQNGYGFFNLSYRELKVFPLKDY